MNAETRDKLKAGSLAQGASPEADPNAVDMRRLASNLKAWSRAHRTFLIFTVVQALRLHPRRDNCLESVLVVSLSPAARPSPYDFSLDEAFVAPMSEIQGPFEVCTSNIPEEPFVLIVSVA